MSDVRHGHIVYNAGILNGLLVLMCSNCDGFIDERDQIKGVCPHCGTIFDDGFDVASVRPYKVKEQKNE